MTNRSPFESLHSDSFREASLSLTMPMMDQQNNIHTFKLKTEKNNEWINSQDNKWENLITKQKKKEHKIQSHLHSRLSQNTINSKPLAFFNENDYYYAAYIFIFDMHKIDDTCNCGTSVHDQMNYFHCLGHRAFRIYLYIIYTYSQYTI